MSKLLRHSLVFAAVFVLNGTSRAWDYEGHRLVNQLALAALPAEFPAFVKSPQAQERIAFLAGEPDRWRNVPDYSLRHFNGPDHYIDLEELADYGLDASSLPKFRYQFAGLLANARAKNPGNFTPIDPAQNEDHTRELVGFLPWTLTEFYGKLKSSFSYLKAFEQEGTPDEIANAQQDIIYIMGVMGHFAGDATQPLHTTKHFNGWVGDNPKHYATNRTFHSWIDGGYMRRMGGLTVADLQSQLRPAHSLTSVNPATKQDEMFSVILKFLVEENKLVEPLYQLNKDGSLSDNGEPGSKGRTFMSAQIAKGGMLLADIWFTAWQNAPADAFLKGRLLERKTGSRRGAPR
jgi:hypothetical protein